MGGHTVVKCDPKAFAKCPTRHLCGTPEDATFAPGSDCDKFNQHVLLQPMTNADRIRAMSDEELAKFICARVENCSAPRCPGAGLCVLGDGYSNGVKKWLQQPAEEE